MSDAKPNQSLETEFARRVAKSAMLEMLRRQWRTIGRRLIRNCSCVWGVIRIDINNVSVKE